VENIQPNAHVVLDYELRDDNGDVVDATESAEYVHGYAMLVPGLEAALVGLKAGDEKEVVLAPDAAFGDHDEELVLEVDRSELPRPEAVAVGDEIVAETPDGDAEELRVVEVKDDAVVLDANHPLAGKTVRYAVKIRAVRAASDEEIAAAARDFDSAGYGADDGGAQNGEQNGADSSLVQLRPKR
jgi:FKBP-type peptidyl-prolyl cis-trans isomerase SlyD